MKTSIASTIKIGNGPNQSSITPSEMEFQISNHSGCNKCPPNDGIVKDQTNDERRCQFGLQSHVFYALFIKCLNKKTIRYHDWSQWMGRFWRRWILVCFCCCEGKNHEQIFWIISKYVKKLARTISFSPISMGFMFVISYVNSIFILFIKLAWDIN